MFKPPTHLGELELSYPDACPGVPRQLSATYLLVEPKDTITEITQFILESQEEVPVQGQEGVSPMPK